MTKLIRTTTSPLSLKYLLRNQMRFMNENGFEVVMVSSDGPELESVISNEQCRFQMIPMTRAMTPVADLKSLWLFYRFLKKEKPQIVHSHTPKAGLIAMLAARLAGVPVRVHTVAGLRFMTEQGFTRKLLIAMEKLTMASATHVWPNSFSLKEYIVKNKLTRSGKLEVIGKGTSNGIDLRRFDPEQLDAGKLQRIKDLIKYDSNCLYLITVGRIVQDKGIDELVSAFINLYKDNNNLRLILVGAFEDEVDPIPEHARKIIHEHPGIILPGWSDEVEYFMKLAYALVHPSHREGFPNVLLQAGAMGCPVICSRIEGNVDIIDHEETGLIFEMKNATELEEKLRYALSDVAAIRAMTTALQQKVHLFFNQPSVHKALHNRYLELLDRK